MAIYNEQTIQKFYSKAIARDFARDINFRLLSLSPGGTTTTFDSNDLVYVRAANLPGRTIKNVPVPYMGLNFNIPGTVEYTNSAAYALNFYCDKGSILRQKLEEWSRDIFDDADSTGNYFTPTQASTMELVQVDNNFQIIGKYKFIGVSIRQLGELQYNIAAGTGEVVQLPATIAYHYYEVTQKPATNEQN